MTEHFSDGYNDVEGLCKVAELSEIEAQGWTLNPGRYVGIPDEEDDGEKDELYDEAVAFVAQSRRASISAVQRRLRVGYNRAARIIETMEEAGVVSPMATNGNREVLIPPPPED